jgi:hypothetical protein
VDVDPVASMRCWAITMDLGGREFEIPALPAVDWWPVLTSVQPRQVLDLLPSSSDLDELILDGKLSAADLGEACVDAIEEATGRSLHVSLVLALAADGNWPTIGGHLAQIGLRWDVVSIGAALDAVYAVIIGNLPDEARTKFEAILENEALTQPGKKRTPSERVLTEFEAMAGPRPAPSVPGQGPPQQSSAEPSGSAQPRTRSQPQQRHQGAPSGVPKRPRAPRARSGPAASS